MDEREKILVIIRDGLIRRCEGYKFDLALLNANAEAKLARYDRSKICNRCGAPMDDADDNSLANTIWANSAKEGEP